MATVLPPRPNFEQFKKQAKDLGKGRRSASPEAAERIKIHLPRYSSATAAEILQGDFALQEAQHVVACEYGCKHWEMLCAVVVADLDVLAVLSDEHIQVLMRRIDQQDFARAFIGAGTMVTERFLSNMSAQELSAEERRDARLKILIEATELAGQGLIVWSDAVA